MKTTTVNLLGWLYKIYHSQNSKTRYQECTLCCSGQSAIDENGKPVGGSMSEQLKLSLENLRALIKKEGYQPANIVKLNFYTTSIPSFFEAYSEAFRWLQKYDCAPTSTLIQVESLAFPALDIEAEATLVN